MQQRLREARDNREDGFTLIELLIVIVVLGILATIVVFGVAQFRDDANTAACKADVRTIQIAADTYEAKNGNYPTSLSQLTGAGGYLKTEPTNVTNAELTWDTSGKTVTASKCPL